MRTDCLEFVLLLCNRSQNVPDRRVLRALDLLAQNRSRPDLAISEIAMVVNVSESRLRHLFQQHVGVSPIQALKLLRLLSARVLLSRSFLEVKEVMAAVGLSDPSHFTRDYKRIFGESPSETQGITTETANKKLIRPKQSACS
jgi:transcriptional regulator GlxA family with amidase domain